MRRVFAAFLLCVGIACIAQAQNIVGSGIYGDVKKASGGGAESYAFPNAPQTANPTGLTQAFTVNLGAASSNRIVVALFGIQNNPTVNSVNGGAGCGSPTLSQVETDGSGGGMSIWAGVVATGTSCIFTITAAGAMLSDDVNFAVYTITNPVSTSVKHICGAAFGCTINVTAGDYLFAGSFGASGNFNGSTQTPSGVCVTNGCTIVGANGNNLSLADWTIVSTNASFSVSNSGSNYNAATSWH